ncbi:TPA: lysine--tRNA ligase [Candidatus Woesearchaeota archaeon]|nr:lysine--tRNA ligase [Candidatus Woesearchaeota archaeon]
MAEQQRTPAVQSPSHPSQSQTTGSHASGGAVADVVPDEHRLIADRKRKLDDLRAKSIAPYPHRYDPTHHAAELQSLFARLQHEERSGERADIAGRIMLLRRMGKVAFATLQDETGRIQLFLKSDVLGDNYDLAALLDLGDIVGAAGEIVKTKTGEVSILVDKLTLLCKSLRPLPEKYHGLKDEEARFRRRYLDLVMNPQVKDLFVKRAKIVESVRQTLLARGFLEVETPMLQTMYGGANARPFITHINAWDMKLYLNISPEQHLKRLLVGGFERVFTICKNFRNEGVDQSHNPEFTMVECYQAYADYNDMMALTESLYENACRAANGGTTVERNGVMLDFKAPWPRITMKDAIKRWGGMDVDQLSDDAMHDLVDEHGLKATRQSSRGDIILALFEHFCEEHLVQPTHVIDHPIESTALCKPMRTGDATMIERFESFCMGMELCNAYSELNDPVLQRKLLEGQATLLRAGNSEAMPMDEDFVQAIEYGMPPAGGLGVGIDRMVIFLTGVEGIRDIILFPTMRPDDQQ